MKKNIYIIDYNNPLNNTGLNSYITILKDHLLNQNTIKLHFIWVDSREYLQETLILNGNIEHIHLPYDITIQGKIYDRCFEALKYIVKSTRNKDNVIFHFNWVNHTPFASILKREIKCKTILTLHCITWRESVIYDYSLFIKINQYLDKGERLSFILKNKLYREIMCYNSVDYIISVTNDAQNVLQKLFEISYSKIFTISNGIDLPIKTKQNKQKLRAKYGFLENEKIILYAGRITESKGVLELIKAFHKLIEKYSDYKYRIIFCGLGNHDLLYKNIKNYSQVTITGNISKEKLYEFYKLADVGVIPSYHEQCSYTAIEMMAHKLPIIVTNVGGLDELVSTGVGQKVVVKFDPQKMVFDINDLAKKIYLTLTEENIVKKQVEKAYQKVKIDFNSIKMIERTLQVYNKITTPNKEILPQYSDLVSVIIPCYNGKKYIERCLQSVLDQTYENIEIILIDDGSQEEVSKILYKFKDNRIKVYRNVKNRGIVFSLNKGIQLSKGEYIARLDVDDIMHRDRILQQITFLKENQQFAMVGSNHILIDDKENVLQYVSYPQTNEEIQAFKYFFNPISHPTVLFRANILKKIRYDNKYPYCEDYSLWFKILKKHKIANIPQYTTYYRMHSENISIRYNKEQLENKLLLILDELEKDRIEISDEELKIHFAIINNEHQEYFNSNDKKNKLKEWIQKFSAHFKFEENIQQIIEEYCNI